MTTGDPVPQPERIRQLILTGEMDQFAALMELEASLSYDLTFRDLGRTCLCLSGPVQDGKSTCWLVHLGSKLLPPSSRNSTGETTISWAGKRVSVFPGMTLQQIYDRALEERLNLCAALHLGLLRASPLPGGRLRLLFAVAGCYHPGLFWRWVDGLTAELHRLGFRPAASLDAPPISPPVSPPSALPAPLAAEPWLHIPDYRWDRHLLRLWWEGYPLKEIAARLSYSDKTLKNRLSALRSLYGQDIVPTRDQLRALKLR